MSSIKIKKLHLLGILFSQDLHGYKLNQMLKHPSNVIKVGKANAYKLLAKMETEGLVSQQKKHQENRPSKLVYSITKTGKEEFSKLLTECMSINNDNEYPNGVALNFIWTLEPQEALSLLSKKQEHLAARCETLNSFSDDIRASHPGIDFIVRQAKLEHELINELIIKFNTQKKENYGK